LTVSSSQMRADALSPWRTWLAAIRPATLTAGAVPVGVGTALAYGDGSLQPLAAIAALLGAILIQIGCNLANDLFDARSGADGADRVGPARATQRGWLTERQVATGALVALTMAIGVGVYLVLIGGWPIVIIGLLSVICAVAYTGGPYPLGYHGLGDIFVLVFFGPVAVGGTYWVQAHALTPSVWVAGLAVGLMATAILVVNNLRDRHSDARAGKRTLAVRLGAYATRMEYALLISGAVALPAVMALVQDTRRGWLCVLLCAPIAARRIQCLWRTDGAHLNPQLGATAQLGLIHGLLLALGVIL
jgi:1,4-dihydroxy-2-naphthoate octaprenyltransferase